MSEVDYMPLPEPPVEFGSLNASYDRSLGGSFSRNRSGSGSVALPNEQIDPGDHWTWDLVLVYKLGEKEKFVYPQVIRQTIRIPRPEVKQADTPDLKHRRMLHRQKTTIINHEAELQKTTWRYVELLRYGKNPPGAISEEEYFARETTKALAALRKANLKTLSYKSIGNDEVYILIGATEARLKEEAERIQHDLLLDPDAAIEAGLRLQPPLVLALRTPTETLLVGRSTTEDGGQAQSTDAAVSRHAWGMLYGKYCQARDDMFPRLYCKWECDYQVESEGVMIRPFSLFRITDRLKLIKSIIETEPRYKGAGIKTSSFKKIVHPLLACFPLHNYDKLNKLEKDWLQVKKSFSQPLTQVRLYFGEHVAFYFGFMETYMRWLVVPSFIGFGAFIVQLSLDEVDNPVTAAFGFLMAIYTTVLLEFWKRKQAAFRTDWGQHNFLEKEQARAEFQGVWQPNPIDGRMQEIFPYFESRRRKMMSQSVIWTLIVVVIGLVSSIFIFRKFLVGWNATYGGIIAGIVNALQIQLMNAFYSYVAEMMNDYENHRTQTEYEDSLIAKSFLFKFVNSYNSLFYIAFFKRFDVGVEGCLDDDPTCLNELQIQLASIFITQLIVNNAIELFVPWYHKRAASIAEGNESIMSLEASKTRTPAEREYEMEEYESTFGDFDEIVIQYGYTTLFVVAFPLTPLLAVISNIVEIRLDAWKLIHLSRRPHPRGAADIGTWYNILEIVSVMAVITNIALAMFVSSTGDDISDSDLTTKFLMFFLFEHIILLAKFLIATLIPDEPYWITEHLKRQQHIVDAIINGSICEPDSVGREEDKMEHIRGELEVLKQGAETPDIEKHEQRPPGIDNRLLQQVEAPSKHIWFERFTRRKHWYDP